MQETRLLFIDMLHKAESYRMRTYLSWLLRPEEKEDAHLVDYLASFFRLALYELDEHLPHCEIHHLDEENAIFTLESASRKINGPFECMTGNE